MTTAIFMEEITRWIDENHYNRVDEKCDDSGKDTKKAGFKLLWNLPSIIYAKLLFDFNILGSLCLLLRSKFWNLNLKNTISYLC
jgi:hypothetical protein